MPGAINLNDSPHDGESFRISFPSEEKPYTTVALVSDRIVQRCNRRRLEPGTIKFQMLAKKDAREAGLKEER